MSGEEYRRYSIMGRPSRGRLAFLTREAWPVIVLRLPCRRSRQNVNHQNFFDLPATKANFLHLKDDLALAKEGRQLLDEKRETLLHELFRHLADLKRCHKEANARA